MTKLGAEEGLIFAKHFAAFLAFSLLGWLVSWWNLSLVGVVFICALYSWKVTFAKINKLHKEKTQRFFKNEKQAIQEIFEDVPRWVFFPDIERVEWINKIAVQLWPDVTSYVRDFLLNNLEAKIQKSMPDKLGSFKFKKIDLGDLPPRITGVKVYSHHVSDDEIIIDMDVFYAGDIAVGIKIAKIEAGVKDIQLKGTLRLVLKPILRHPPFVGGIQLYFLTNPTLDFALTDVARVLEIPGLHALLKTTILTQIANYLILPNKMVYSLSSAVSSMQLYHIEPKGVLRVQVVEAKNLISHDLTSKSDPYITVSVATEQFSTAVQKNTHNPVWDDEIHFFTVLQMEGVELKLQIFDKDDASQDDVIGRGESKIHIALRSIAREGYADVWRDLPNDEGSVHFICTWFELKSEVPPSAIISGGSSGEPTAILSVFVDSAKNLEILEETEPSTLVTLTVGADKKHTSSVLSTPNPSYNENFHFLLNDFTLFETLTLKVCDVDSDDVYGTVTKPLSSITNAAGMTVHRPHVLTGGAGVSELLIRASIKYLVSPNATAADASADDTDDESADPTDNRSDSTTDGVDTPVNGGSSPASPTDTDDTVSGLRRRRVSGGAIASEMSEARHASAAAKQPNAGDVELTMTYLKSQNLLTVSVLRCRELLAYSELSEDEAPDTYVKLRLMPEKSHKYKTDTYKDSFYPVFDETFQFTVPSTEVLSQSLQVIVKQYESIFSKVEIGEANIPLSTMSIDKSSTKWYPLQQMSGDRK